jgi:hypothetical protein
MTQRATITWTGDRAIAEIERAAARGLALWTEAVLTESNAHVPIDEGTLERSGVAQVDGGALEGAVDYDMPYAVRQHEDLEARHAPGRTAKYLERALNATRESGPQVVATEIRRVTGGG